MMVFMNTAETINVKVTAAENIQFEIQKCR